jgi:DNA-binding CsgD family transcriptional regulator
MGNRDPNGLTAREREVLDLVRLGLTNEEIAERLVITLDGAKHHVSQILSKLGVATREEAAALTAEPERRRWWVAPPLAAKAAGAALIVAAVAGLGVVAWGALETSGDDKGSLAAAPTQRVTNEAIPTLAIECALSPDPSALAIFGTYNQMCWRDVPDEARYRVFGSVEFWPGCGEHIGLARRVQPVDEFLPANSQVFPIPPSLDAVFPEAEGWQLAVQALASDGQVMAENSVSYIGEIDYSHCSPSSTP